MPTSALVEPKVVEPAVPSPRGRLWAARVLWLLVALTVAALYAEMIPRNVVQTRHEWVVEQAMNSAVHWMTFTRYVTLVVVVEMVVVGVYVGAALVIAWRRHDDAFALFVSAALLLLSVNFGISGNLDALYWPPSVMAIAPWLPAVLPAAILAAFALLFFLLPDGRFVPGWLKWSALPGLTALVLTVLALFGNPSRAELLSRWTGFPVDAIWRAFLGGFLLMLLAGPVVQLVRTRRSGARSSRVLMRVACLLPFTSLVALAALWWADPDDELAWMVFVWSLLTPMLLGLAGQVYRYVHETDPVRRQQIKWLAWGLASPLLGLLIGMALRIAIGDQSVFYALENLYSPLLTTLLPLSILFSMLRFRLWGIDRLANRTLVYGGLTLVIALLYVLLVGLLSTLLPDGTSAALSVAATGLIALLFQPLHRGLQRLANRLVYGDRDDPAAVLARLGRRLEGAVASDAMLPTIVETVAQALKLPYVAIVLRQDGDQAVVAHHGTPSPEPCPTFPLIFQGEIMGHLLVAPRSPGERLTAGEQRLLADVAQQAGPAVHAVQLTTELQRSRAQLVAAREEERRRLRRDLHDGLGPRLATLSMKIDAARNLLARDPATVDRLLREYKQENQELLADLRRLVYDLRSPALDQLGLVSALRDYVANHQEVGALHVQIDVPDPLPPLPAAVEVAVYRIVLEALTNVVRHAHAHSCAVTLRAQGDMLLLAIADDGRGMDDRAPRGVGVTSMCERAEELGGHCVIGAGPQGGTRVAVTLPLATGGIHDT